eukprot:Blabericola_migrator_1__7842@NODE_4008_length_1387_cov_829_018182_g2471_i0_p1_GENE_NODE_4008_length_1387_cov_829_018182_g2471_i0NODE_4008_length_1387_cov_829_018182_g2471_i0_p1_ORF_typecomplete_len404_score92_90EF1G/PF00647_19/4_7e33GST_C/PF00043_25/1_3e07GST_C_2/PF13410_6/1_1e06GST_C_2/PF13410_6/4e03GST_C_3/PF14497_6/4_7e06GST_C_3/PF14497_6/3_1e03GST_C_6/PF17171_4/0_16Spo0A_C/PF08769_11/0_18Phage_holin_5_1/PF06946_11/0_41_NODE_4008_length_1387_cov_829_018182_g2471_i0901301
MQLTLYAGANCFLKAKVEAAAKIVGDSVVRKEVETYPKESALLFRHPALLTPSGYVSGSNASLRYIGNAHPTYELYGRSSGERAAIDSAVDAISAELETPIVAYALNRAPLKVVVGDVMTTLTTLDAALAKQTYLVGERLSLADLALAGAVAGAVAKGVLKAEELSPLYNLCRLYNTVAGRCSMTPNNIEPKIESKIEQLEQSPSTKEQKGGKKQQPQKKESKPSKVEAGPPSPRAEPAPAPKQKDPIEELPPTNFDLEAWKRYYSNSKDLKGDAMPWLWEHLDKEGFAFYHMEYIRYKDDENTKAFMASNLLGMFLQRIDNWLRKYMFGVCDILQEDGYFSVQGIFLWRGQDVPKRLQENDQYESFKWTKLDADKDKDRIIAYFCEEDVLEGKAIQDSKVYK